MVTPFQRELKRLRLKSCTD